MAGGVWLGENKIRPGAYLNFTSIPRPSMTIGERGIAIIPLELDWGSEDSLIPVLSSELLTDVATSSVGFNAFEEKSKLLNLLLSNCYKALVYRLNKGGLKAKATLGSLVATAKHPGTLGNRLAISVYEVGTRFQVRTYLDAVVRDTQTVSTMTELRNNSFLIFSGELDFDGIDLEDRAGEYLTGGTNGATGTTAYKDFFAMANFAKWQTMAIPSQDPLVAEAAVVFCENQHNAEGRYRQCVVPNYEADNFVAINVTNGVILQDGTTVEPWEAVTWVAGITAGARITESNTAKIFRNAVDIINEKTHSEIETALLNGEFVFTRNTDNKIKVEQDINSFISFTGTMNEWFSKNKIIRIIHEIGTTVTTTWENKYMGKVNNNRQGRSLLRGDIVQYMNQLQDVEAIQEFTPDLVVVRQGQNLAAVRVDLDFMPVDVMEFLYMNVRMISISIALTS